MKLIRSSIPWNPSFNRLDDWFLRAFDELGGLSRVTALPSVPDRQPRAHLAADVFEDDHHYFVRVEIPGAKREEIGVRLEDGALHVSYQRKGGENDASLALSRAFRLPGPVVTEEVSAKLEDGILVVSLPRHEAAKPKTIAVE